MITVLSLSPAVDKIYIIDNFCAGELYRVNNCIQSPGGKGLTIEDSFLLGCACATSNTEFIEIGMINIERVQQLKEKIIIKGW